VPAAQKENRRHRSHDKHVRILSDEKEREAHSAVFGVKSCGEFAFSFRKVERRTVGLSHAGNEVDEERNRLQKNEPYFLLCADNLFETEGITHEDHSQH